METFKGEGSDNKLLERYSHTTTRISPSMFLVYGGWGNYNSNQNSMILIEIEDLIIPAFHLVEVTGMLEFLGRNMCSELYDLM